MKTCSACGKANEDGAAFCNVCGAALPAPLSSAAQAAVQQTSGKALASMILGFLFLLFPAAIAAVVLGHVSNSEIRKSGGRLKGARMALTGTILGYVGIALIPISVVMLIAAIAIPNLIHARMTENELSAVTSLRKISQASLIYFDKYNRYPPSLAALGPPADGQAVNAEAADLLSVADVRMTQHGYIIVVAPAAVDAGPGSGSFCATADPVAPGTSGIRHFYVDETGVIRQEKDGRARRGSPVLQ